MISLAYFEILIIFRVIGQIEKIKKNFNCSKGLKIFTHRLDRFNTFISKILIKFDNF